MKKLSLILLLCMLPFGVVSCNSAWWQQFSSNPEAQVQSFEVTVQIGLNAAELAWPAILPLIPTANQAQANQQFTNAISTVNHLEQVLNDAVAVAVATKQSTPDFTAAMQAVGDALAQVIAIVNTYTQSPTPVGDGGITVSAPSKVILTGSSASNVADLNATYTSLKGWGVKLK